MKQTMWQAVDRCICAEENIVYCSTFSLQGGGGDRPTDRVYGVYREETIIVDTDFYTSV